VKQILKLGDELMKNTDSIAMSMSLPCQFNNQIHCYYVNPTNQIQIIRITNIPNWYFEKAAFPKQLLMFEAFPEAILEIRTEIRASAILSDQIQCNLLHIKEKVSQLKLKDDVA
jgi:hypothetical protein